MLDADQVALAAVAEADRMLGDEVEAAATPLDPALGGRFTTATMAELLEEQGDASGASRIRAALDVAPDDDARTAGANPSRETVIRTLEAWLENVRQGARA